MAPALRFLGAAVAASVLLSHYQPKYNFGLFSTSVLLFFVQVLLYQAYWLFIYPRFISPLRNVPTATGAGFFLGHTRKIMRETNGMPMREWVETVPNDGLIRYSMWGSERLLVASPKALGEVLVTKNYEFIKPAHFRHGLGRILGIGILLAEGDEHRTQRKNLMPAFAYRHVKELVPVFWKKSREMVECLGKASKLGSVSELKDGEKVEHAPGAVEVNHWTSRATLDIIGVSGMGKDFNSLQNPDNGLYKTYQTVFSPGRMGRILQLLGMIFPMWFLRLIPVKRNADMSHSSEYIKQTCRELIAHKRKEMAEKERTDVDIISVALESGHFSDEDLVNQMMTFLAAGHETTATSMIWVMYLLCKHPDIQKKLRDEIHTTLPGGLNKDVTAAELDECHYLHAVCLETLRLWSPVSLTMRVAAKDSTINGQFVPKDTTIILAPWAINTSTQLWGPDAKEFKPERWLDAEGRVNHRGSADSNYSFLTFLHGPRSCIGQRFAQAEFACLVAAWIGRFETEFEDPSLWEADIPDIKGGITSKPKGGVWVKLREVEGW
ncbi:cytochrome P450 [Teratosphaeria nubilosa]|uniref:Cytochrome P450 n=1 Tax=Teratosphaeria nubilosa TaxID=161662 RepID=A0A6G1LIK2_9PEZI|nr:cytochrome P450 [Teratosphaeria nubilosa]